MSGREMGEAKIQRGGYTWVVLVAIRTAGWPRKRKNSNLKALFGLQRT